MQIDDTLHKKIVNEATAYLRSYVSKRERNRGLAATAVTDAKAFSDKEALDGKLVDIVAASTEDLLAQLNGRTITRFDGINRAALALASAIVVREMTGREKFLSRIVAARRIFHSADRRRRSGFTPSSPIPGCLRRASSAESPWCSRLFAMHMLPVNLAGLLLIALALALFVLEAKFPTHGVLGVGRRRIHGARRAVLIRSPLTGMGVSLGPRWAWLFRSR